MIELIIVDDEYIIRERLKKCIDWNELGYVVIGECENGLQALEMVDEKTPKVAIIDINMPIMDGLKFAEYIALKKLNMYIIILTGYAEFDYAKEAMKHGVYRYLLKPINKDELYQCLILLRDEIVKENEKKRIQIKNNYQLALANEKNSELEWLEFLINPTVFNSNTWIETIKFNHYNCNYIIMVCSINSITNSAETVSNEKIWLFSIKNILKEQAVNKLVLLTSLEYEGNMISCFMFDKYDIGQMEISAFFKHYLDTVKKLLPIEITIGISHKKEKIDELPIAYKEAKIALIQRLVEGNEKVIFYSSMDEKEDYCLDASFLNEIIRGINQGDLNLIQRILKDSIANIIQCKSWYSNLHKLVSLILIATDTVCDEHKISYDQFFAQDVTSSDVIDEIGNIDNLSIFLLGKIESIIEVSNRSITNKKSKIIEDIIEFININYFDERLNLKYICAHIHANISYISSQFKKETGININAYITNKRMVEAQRIKKTGNFSVEELALKVGYKDPYYFSKCYKKYYGISPSKGQNIN